MHHIPLAGAGPRIVDRRSVAFDARLSIGFRIGIGEVERGVDNFVNDNFVNVVNHYIASGRVDAGQEVEIVTHVSHTSNRTERQIVSRDRTHSPCR